MATDVTSKLAQLRARRQGPSRVQMESVSASITKRDAMFADPPLQEDWEQRGSTGQQWTRYALGAMQAVSRRYTEISEETGTRVANQLRDRLKAAGINVDFKLQGSVPLNVHIKGVSDVDLLAISADLLTYAPAGVKAQQGYYGSTSRTSVGVLREIRLQVEVDLEAAFPQADVDKSRAKAVKVSGGSLQRSVDVVPSHWFDTLDYQASGRPEDRGVTIFNKATGETLANFPFLHIDRIGSRCDSIGGGLRKAIRLCKSLKADSERDIQLSSYDLGAIMFHADMSALRLGQYSDLTVLAETQRHLDWLLANPAQADLLRVPDNSRAIFESSKKRDWLLNLSLDVNDLLSNVYDENASGLLARYSSPTIKRDLVKSLTV
jgi:hypothetical protein